MNVKCVRDCGKAGFGQGSGTVWVLIYSLVPDELFTMCDSENTYESLDTRSWDEEFIRTVSELTSDSLRQKLHIFTSQHSLIFLTHMWKDM